MGLKLRKPNHGSSGALVNNMVGITKPEPLVPIGCKFYSGQATNCCRDNVEDDECYEPPDTETPRNIDLGLPAGYRRTAFEEQVFFSARASTDPLVESVVELPDSDFDELDGSYLDSLGEDITFSLSCFVAIDDDDADPEAPTEDFEFSIA